LNSAHALVRSLNRLSLRGRQLLVFDLVAICASFVASFALRFDAPSAQFDQYLGSYLWMLPFLIVARLGGFVWLRLYQRVWRYASIEELTAVITAVVGSSAAVYSGLLGLMAVGIGHSPAGFPRSVPIIDTVLLIGLAGVWRFGLRLTGVGRKGAGRNGDAGLRTLIAAEGHAAAGVIRQLLENGDPVFQPVGLLADDLVVGERLLRVPVLGKLDALAKMMESVDAEAVLLALPSARGRALRKLVHEAEVAGVRCFTMPSVAEVMAGRVTMNALREVEVEDLLRRAPARIDVKSVSGAFRGRTVLVTGAGGSIGAELSRQLAYFHPKRLVVLGRGENSIFELLTTLPTSSGVEIVPIILDIRERERLDRLIADIRPDVIFHAAAHKHVPLMEMFPEEAVATNVIGTANLLDAAVRNGVDRFVLISTDKAVNPTSVMGATKRLAERLVVDSARKSGRRYAAVRFGNVLSSRGSVVPTFRRQLSAGGPITVTHPEATRFFMTIAEAVQLVLQAAALAEPADIFVLDMGEPVRIVDLAADLIELHGLKVGEDVDIEFVGLRPGEKVSEELLFGFERAGATPHEAIRRITQTLSDAPAPADFLQDLEQLSRMGRTRELIEVLQRAVPEYASRAEENGDLLQNSVSTDHSDELKSLAEGKAGLSASELGQGVHGLH
jgi:FlaA1/EpsC-like NDP-sugar epimerase